jgi:mono/diheme cytochrome c family protein
MRARALALLCGASLLAGGAASAAESRGEGERVARDACATCHQVKPGGRRPEPVWDPDQRTGVRAPSFAEIARDPAKDAIYIRSVLAQPHAPMKEQMLSDDDREALVRYIRSLAPKARRRG